MSILDENIRTNESAGSGLNVTGEMKRNWTKTSKWAMFFSILGFIYIGLSLLMIGSMSTVIQMMASMTRNPVLEAMGPLMSYFTVFTLLMMAVMFFIHFYHIRFAGQIQRAVNFTDQVSFEKAWLNLRNHFRLFGITICVVLALYLVALIAIGALVSQTSGLE